MNYAHTIIQMQQHFLLFYNENNSETFRTHRVYKTCIFWKTHNSKRLCLKLLNFFMKASLVETVIRVKFQVEIQKYDFAEKMESCRENLLKIIYLANKKPMWRIPLRFLCTLWALSKSKIWAQTKCISWWGSLVSQS